MRNYIHLSWLIHGTAFLFLVAQPSQATTETQSVLDSKSKLEFKEISAVNSKIENLSFSEVNHNPVSVEEAIKIATPKIPTEIAQAAPMLPNPKITIEDNKGNPFEPPTANAPETNTPVLPRAVAPPVGDIAISNIDASSQKVKFNTGSVVIPRVLLRDASVREVLMTLANYAGYNVVFIDGGQSEQNAAKAAQIVSLEFNNESVEDIFNSVLMVSGYSANVRGRTIFVGAVLPSSARNLISRTLRVNQVKAVDAASYLAAQGAEYPRLVTEIEEIIDPLTQRVIGTRTKTPEFRPLTIKPDESSTAAILLQGLKVVADDRLNAVTLIGEPRLVQIASSMLLQLDARRRQVVVNVKVIDVNLLNTDDFNSSFSFGFNNGFFLQDGGAAVLNFGGVNPPSRAEVTGGAFSRPVIPLINTIVGGAATLAPFFDIQSGPFSDARRGFEEFSNNLVPYSRPNFGTFNNPFQPGLSDIDIDPATGQRTYTYELPGLFQYPQKFLLSLEAQITSGNAKILTDPSIVVQEGQQANISVTEKVIGSIKTEVDPLSGVRTTTPVLADAGLILNVNLNQVDDNGFISLSVNPTIASPGPTVSFDSGNDAVNQITLLNTRQLNSGLIRLRDGQTLILSGIIQESDQTSESKVPILGDIPILGALFRRRSNQTGRNEVVIILTPKILDDNAESAFGYDYQPGKDAAEILKRQGFPVQPMP
ncbi:secretin N-terminal domain-containing protein [Chroococcus sp. FPU101]|uniref:secretin N-terminal domain-containing protein n=1 Tax=Chroococcus sp. FPU101 TaxID=1974212 RepID=UPI001AA5A8C1|nr:secretin N-terminal domain-containing protein [Chroococcus sp. FPU101]GFE70537.1 type IV pilus assembly protein PilQ [Chroococcus sp. FPU101]